MNIDDAAREIAEMGDNLFVTIDPMGPVLAVNREAIAAILRKHFPPQAWMPIETAPKDGTPVLLWDECEYIGRWSPSDEGWLGALHINATHWQPLPQPPEANPQVTYDQ